MFGVVLPCGTRAGVLSVWDTHIMLAWLVMSCRFAGVGTLNFACVEKASSVGCVDLA